jgi:hypothetical protein
MSIIAILNKLMNILSCRNIQDDMPKTPRTPKGQKSPKIYNKWDDSFLNDKFNQSENFKQNEFMSKYNSLPTTPCTPKGQISPKIYGKWNVMFIDNNFKLTPKSIINTHKDDIHI